MIATTLVSGLAALWLWVVLNDEDGVFGSVTRLFYRNRWTKKWLSCSWCSGAWFAIVASATLYHPSMTGTIITALASAAITGLIGSYIQGD